MKILGIAQLNAVALAAASLLAASPAMAMPPIGLDFDVAATTDAASADILFIAWADEDRNLRSGLLLADGSFSAFPTVATGYITNLHAGVGGPAGARRAYAGWVGPSLEFMLTAFDLAGDQVMTAGPVSHAVQISPLQFAGTDSGALAVYAYDTNPFWDPRILNIGLDGNIVSDTIVGQTGGPEQTLGVTVAAAADGRHVVGYVTSDTRLLRLRRYAAAGPIDAGPLTVAGDVVPNYLPRATLFDEAGKPFVLIAFPTAAKA